MTTDVIVPRLGSSDESDEVRILRWLKSPGAEVKKARAYWKLRPIRSTS
jgi:pyruvate/2-oxoglutarate dehydrogenase complex dihydrolipoamide acyltransferase (E2) component